MRLDEFVKETILQIAKGVQDADKELSAAGSQAKIVPMGNYDYQGIPAMNPRANTNIKSGIPVSLVEFRVKVEIDTSEETATKVGGNIKVISADKDVRTQEREGRLQEVSFCVPMALFYR